jgi:dolichyl-phosphate beta-glucosyltransferase
MISVVIPCFNEEMRLEPGLSNSIKYMSSNIKQPFEVILVNDGSTDRTREILDSVKIRNKDIPIRILNYSPNQGKGHAVKTGVLASEGEKVIVMDADFSIDLSEAPKVIEKLEVYDIVVGTKKHALTRSVKKQNIPRRFLGKGFTVFTNLLLGLNFTDITCGLKGFRALAAKNLFRKQRMKRWAYDAETLFLAKQFKYNFTEIPVKWFHVEGSKVSPALDAARSLRDLMAIIVNYNRGKYD